VVTVPPPPQIILGDGSLGWHSNRFGFNFNGVVGQIVVVEGSANLLFWEPLYTNTLGFAPLLFTDPGASGLSARFYRLRAP
jgi:hypothetical protein